ncbi:MAG: relaxase domain-containing protein, partial [Propionibacteriaceae bacterium]|nr:relaxase domain-containing protein [Propionibacteriaceae bacterium]
MSLKKLSAGNGYLYLVQQVAAQDSTGKSGVSLATYYEQKGESPGAWVGCGVAGIEGLHEGDLVTANQMKNLFGEGIHPFAQKRMRALRGTKPTKRQFREAVNLGRPFYLIDQRVNPFRQRLSELYAEFNTARGLDLKAKIPFSDRARMRTELGKAMFKEQHGRESLGDEELGSFIAKVSRECRQPVAGYDLTFSPVKSVSSLWALALTADPGLAAKIEAAHNKAISDALGWIESYALYTRRGNGGVRKERTKGLVGALFTHRDARSGDPDLHTHVAVSNKVQAVSDDQWCAIDGTVFHKAAVTASEVYNTMLERHLEESVGVRFAARANSDPAKRPVRELDGMSQALLASWSSRAAAIAKATQLLSTSFQATHGRPPTQVEMLKLAQTATLDTRAAKHEPRSVEEQAAQWWEESINALGGEEHVLKSIDTVLHPQHRVPECSSPDWEARAIRKITASVETSKSAWTRFNVQAEAWRQARYGQVPASAIHEIVSRLHTGAILGQTRISRDVDDPVAHLFTINPYRDIDGTQVYTSQRILDAEQRICDAAGLRGGMAVSEVAVDLALLEAQANAPKHFRLNAGQAMMVREMATSGRRLQLGIAPAGAGKTTAMRTLASAWANENGHIVGLAPSAAASHVLRDATGVYCDTIDKLVFEIENGSLPQELQKIGPESLVIIDEAGMANTLTLDAAITWILGRGASIRLIGDDQQLASVGAGGVLRDIKTVHGALSLSELVRFKDPAEAAASLAIRSGDTSSLGFYFDNRRIHQGDLGSCADQLFQAWIADTNKDLDSIMVAPTLDLVSQLNYQGRLHRLSQQPSAPNDVVALRDGNQASAGDTIITRRNDRRLRTSRTDYVKNGDRWLVKATHPDGSIHVVHKTSGLGIALPKTYVDQHVDLGYATTVHTTQGITADTMHGILKGTETRQLAYTMMTRGVSENHLYVVTVSEGDEHSAIWAESLTPPTANEVLEMTISRDQPATSATTIAKQSSDPRAQLAAATSRYVDALMLAAERHVGAEYADRLEDMIDEISEGNVVDQPAWASLRSQLLLAKASGKDPIAAYVSAWKSAPITNAEDVAKVMAWRLDGNGRRAGNGPLPWLPGIPDQLKSSPCGEDLQARFNQVRTTAAQISKLTAAASKHPAWVAQLGITVSDTLISDIEVFRAANGVEPADLRATGQRGGGIGARRWQKRLDARLKSNDSSPGMWQPLFNSAPQIGDDSFLPSLERRLSHLSSLGVDVPTTIRRTLAGKPLPAEHAAAALWYRISKNLSPAVAAESPSDYHLSTRWLPQFRGSVGPPLAAKAEQSTWWPSLVAAIEHCMLNGYTLQAVTAEAKRIPPDTDIDPAKAMLWRITTRCRTDIPDEHPHEDESQSSDYTPAYKTDTICSPLPYPFNNSEPPPDPYEEEPLLDDLTGVRFFRPDLSIKQKHPTPEENRLADQRIAALNQASRALNIPTNQVDDCLHWVNDLALQYFQQCWHGSWASAYLALRAKADLTNHELFRPGYAPPGWDNLVRWLRRHKVSHTQMIQAGVAKINRAGRMQDVFRDRLVFPITHQGKIVGFTARRNPESAKPESIEPKYINTAETAIFHKSACLFGLPAEIPPDAVPVIVEGALDAI